MLGGTTIDDLMLCSAIFIHGMERYPAHIEMLKGGSKRLILGGIS